MSLELKFQVPRRDFTLEVATQLPGSGVTAILGPSGCGKTSLLRAIAGLDSSLNTYLQINGEIWEDAARGIHLPTHTRPLAYVFQEASLFPHLTVEQNVVYGWKRTPASRRTFTLEQMVEWFGIGHLLQRDPATLSGGERQRVAMARALATSPSLLLMDEPLAALDEAGKADILPYLERLHETLSIPVLYVSHAMEEVMRFADQLLLLEQGRVVANGPIEELLVQTDLPLARTEGAASLLTATVEAHDEAHHLSILDFPGGQLSIVRQELPLGSQQRVRIHARDVSLTLAHHQDSSILNIFPARVRELQPLQAGQVLVKLGIGDDHALPLLARVTEKSVDHLQLAPGLTLFAQVKSVALLR